MQPVVAAHDSGMTAASTSGAGVSSISVEAAENLMAQADERLPGPIDVAFGAVEDDGRLIGVAVLCSAAFLTSVANATLVVSADRRRLNIGTDLMHRVVAEAGARRLSHLKISYPATAVAADAFLGSLGLVTAKRVLAGTVTTVVAVPS